MDATEHGRAAWSSIEPQSHWILVVGAIDTLDEDVVKGAVDVSGGEVSRVDGGVEGTWISLNKSEVVPARLE